MAGAVGKPAIPDYELVRVIGRGSYGDVWLARSLTGTFRAIKIVWLDRFSDSQPFDREFRGLTEFAAISLVDARQLALLHVGRNDAGGFFYYVMELADDIANGRKIDPDTYLPHTLSELKKRRGRLPAAECVAIGVELAQGLAYLHDSKLVHRDVKPSNVIFVGGLPKLADIGLVSAAEQARTFVGTEGFVPLEGPGMPAADVFSLGKVLYELSTGLDRKDFPRLPPDVEKIADHRAFLELNEVVLRACEPDLARRYPNAKALLDDLLVLKSGRSVRRLRRAEWLSGAVLRAAAALAIVALVAGAGGWIWLKVSPAGSRMAISSEPAPVASPQSIAVLPFANLSPDPANMFFADGVHEDVINSLAKIHDLKVISRTSVMVYRLGTRNLRAIAAELGVANILEGSVQRDGNKVRVAAQLVNASADRPIWAETYDRNLTDVFTIQSDLANEIAAALSANLTAGERQLIGQRPTKNQEAYDLFLRARALREGLSIDAKLSQFDQVIALYLGAIAKDPEFSQAYAQLSLLHSSLYRFTGLDPSPARLDRAKEAAAAAVRLAPSLPEGKLALGVIAELDEGDWNLALHEFRGAESDLPNDDQLLWWIGDALRRLGRWDEAVDYFERSSTLNPRVVAGRYNAVQTLFWLRRYSRVRENAEKYLAKFPGHPGLSAYLAYARYEVDGDREEWARAVEKSPPDSSDPNGIQSRYHANYIRENLAAADRALSEVKGGLIPSNLHMIYNPVSLDRAMIAYLTGQNDKKRLFAENALAYFQAGTWNPRQKPWVLIGQAEAEACAGKSKEALEDANAAWASVYNHDAMQTVFMQPLVGEVYLMLGHKEDAIEILRNMMTGPCSRGPRDLRNDPLWRRLKGDPRFESMLDLARAL